MTGVALAAALTALEPRSDPVEHGRRHRSTARACPVGRATGGGLGGARPRAGSPARRQAPRFGYDTDNYLGQKPQRNPWTDDGHDFFATHRLLRYLTEPRSEQVLTAADRAAVERIANRLPDLAPPSLPLLNLRELLCMVAHFGDEYGSVGRVREVMTRFA